MSSHARTGSAFEIRFPNVEGYVYALKRPSIRADFHQDRAAGGGAREYTHCHFPPHYPGIHRRLNAWAADSASLWSITVRSTIKQFHLQEIEFEIARQVVATLVGEGAQAPVSGTARMRGQARHLLFPQVLRIVQRFVKEKVDFRISIFASWGLEKYVQRIRKGSLMPSSRTRTRANCRFFLFSTGINPRDNERCGFHHQA